SLTSSATIVANTYSLSAAGSISRPSLLTWLNARATFPSSQSVNPATASTASAHPSARGPRASHRNTGTPRRRRKLSRFGTVQIRSSAEVSLTPQTLLCELPAQRGRFRPARGRQARVRQGSAEPIRTEKSKPGEHQRQNPESQDR